MANYDLIVVGGGNAITVATRVAEAGQRVALVEEGPLGGTCPNRGCIPSKLVLGYAEAAHAVREAGRFHVRATLEGIDGVALLAEMRDYIDRFDELIGGGLPETLTLFRGRGRFADDRTIVVNGESLTAPRIVVATGSRPRRPEIDVPYWTSDEVFRIERLPESITIVGGGYIGCELGTFFAGVGVDTLVLHRHEHLLGREDPETRALFERGFREVVPVRSPTGVQRVEYDGARYRLTLSDGGVRESEALLYAIGRVPNSDDLGLERTSLRTDARGHLPSDDRLRTGVEGIYSLGDLAGLHMFTHSANFEAEYLARALLEDDETPIDYGAMPHAVFATPEVAGIGPTEPELQEAGTDYVKGLQPYDGVTKGRAIKERHGLAKMLVGRDGKILACHIVGAHASILLHEVIPVMRHCNHVRSLTEIIHVHPSLPEVVRGAARKAAAQL